MFCSENNEMQSFDVIIVGGGASGCVIANRLSEDTDRRVLLVEAGADTPPDKVPLDVLDSYPGRAYLNPSYTWPDLNGYLRPVPHNSPERPPLARYEQARILGGGSSINGQVAARGFPADYDDWAELGANGWRWKDVLPYFRKLERDLDFNGPDHGQDGPIPIRRIFRNEWDGLTRAAAGAFEHLGFVYRKDMNAMFDEGFFPAPFTNENGQRVSTAIGYLGANQRRRKNLSIRCNSQVKRIVFEHRVAVGIELELAGGLSETIRGRHIFVTAGAIHTPALLQRSGVGPALLLKEFGIPVVANRAGVGHGLQDHAAVSISAFLQRKDRFDERTRRHIHMHLRYSSNVEGGSPLDMVINTASRSAWHPLGQQIGSFQLFVGKPFSRGSVKILSGDWRTAPEVRFELLSDRRDHLRLMEAMRLMALALQEEPLKSVALDPFPSSYSSKVRRIGALKVSNQLLTAAAAFLLEGPTPLRRALLRYLVAPGAGLAELVSNEDALSRFVSEGATPTWHACSTCRMGSSDDINAVTDSSGKVYGIEGLSIGDASLMPAITRGNTVLPTIMIAEKISEEWRCSFKYG